MTCENLIISNEQEYSIRDIANVIAKEYQYDL